MKKFRGQLGPRLSGDGNCVRGECEAGVVRQGLKDSISPCRMSLAPSEGPLGGVVAVEDEDVFYRFGREAPWKTAHCTGVSLSCTLRSARRTVGTSQAWDVTHSMPQAIGSRRGFLGHHPSAHVRRWS